MYNVLAYYTSYMKVRGGAPPSFIPVILPFTSTHWALAQGLCQKCLKVWGGAAGRKHSYRSLIFLPHGD